MKTVQITKEVKQKLDKFSGDKSINNAMKELLKDAETHTPQKPSKIEYVNIHMDNDLLIKLKNCKKSTKESHSITISRLIDEYNERH